MTGHMNLEDVDVDGAVREAAARVSGDTRLGFLRKAGLAFLLLLLAGLGWAVWRYTSGHVMADEAQQHAVSSAATPTPTPPGH